MCSSNKSAVWPRPTSECVLELRRVAACFDLDASPSVRIGELPFCRRVAEWMIELMYLTSLGQVRISPFAPVATLVERVLRQLLPERGEFAERLRPYVESSVQQVIRERVVMDYRMARRRIAEAEVDIYCRRHRTLTNCGTEGCHLSAQAPDKQAEVGWTSALPSRRPENRSPLERLSFIRRLAEAHSAIRYLNPSWPRPLQPQVWRSDSSDLARHPRA